MWNFDMQYDASTSRSEILIHRLTGTSTLWNRLLGMRVVFLLLYCLSWTTPGVLAGRAVIYPNPNSTSTVLIEDHERDTLVQSPGGLFLFLCEGCPEEVSLHTTQERIELVVSWIGNDGRSSVFSDDVHVSIDRGVVQEVELPNNAVNSVLLNVLVTEEDTAVPLTVRVGNWSKTIDIFRDTTPPIAEIDLLSQDDEDDVHEYRLMVRFSESVVQGTRRRTCGEVDLISIESPLSTVQRQSEACNEELTKWRISNGVTANGVASISSIVTGDNTALYAVIRTPSRLEPYDINVTLSSNIEDFSGNALAEIPHLMLYYRPVIGMPSIERVDRLRKRQVRLPRANTYGGAKTAGRIASVAVVGSCASTLTGSAGSGASGGSTTLINNVQKLHMTGLLAVTNMPDGYKNFTNEVGWAVLDIDTPWKGSKKNRTSSNNTRTNQRSLKQFDASLEAGDEEDELDYFERIMFWVPVIFVGIVVLHLLLLVIFFLKEWELPDILQPPRIELMLAFFLLPPLAIAAAGLYQGTRGEAILATWLIIAVPVNFLCWNFFMLWYHILRLPPHLREANQITDIPSQKQRAIKKLRSVITFSRSRSLLSSRSRRAKTSADGGRSNTELLSRNNSDSAEPEEGTGDLTRDSTMYRFNSQEVNSQGEEDAESENEAFSCGEIYELLSNMNWLTLLFGEHQSEADWTATRQQGSKFVARFGPLFEDHRGPAIGRRGATLDVDPLTGKVDRGELVAIRERPLIEIPAIGEEGSLFYLPKKKIYRFHLQIVAKMLDISKTILVGCIVAGVGNSDDNIGSIVALIVLSFTLLFLFRLAKPFPSRLDMLLLILTEFADLIVYTCALFLLIGPDADQETYDNIAVALIFSEGFALIAMIIEYTLISIGLALLAWEAWEDRYKTKFFDLAYSLMKEDGKYLERKYSDLWMVKVLKRGLNGREPERHELPWRHVLRMYMAQNGKKLLWLKEETRQIVNDAKRKFRVQVEHFTIHSTISES